MGGLAQATRGFLESGGVPAPTVIATSVPSANLVVLTWSQPVTLTVFGATTAAYAIVPPPATPAVSVTAVTLLDSTHLQLTTTDQENGASYQLNISQGAVQNIGIVTNFATSVFFSGSNAPLTIASHQLVDSTDLLVTYSRGVQQASASVPSNYVFVPALVVDLVERVTDTIYRIRTARMQPTTIYAVTVSGVRAFDGSLI